MSDPAPPSRGEDEPEHDKENDDGLPERIIVIREPIGAEPDAATAELEALAAEAAAAGGGGSTEPAAVAHELPGWAPPPVIDVDEVDLRDDEVLVEAIAVDADLHDPEPGELEPDEPDELDDGPERDETGAGTPRPMVPEPVIAARTPPTSSRRALQRVRALLGLVFVVILSGVGLAAAIGLAVLVIVLVLSRAFGSGT